MAAQRTIRGRVWKFGACLDSGNIAGVMAGVDPEFRNKVRPGDIIVAGANFGMGSSSEHAPRSLKEAGIAAVVAESISNIYLRTLVNIGLPAIECPGISEMVAEGDEVEIDLRAGKIHKLGDGEIKNFTPFSDYALAILEKGGLIPFLRETLGNKGRPEEP